tara:strand:- start:12229 stop:12642 length:414 start_codon:yes stop_codon:yes gene_type:complete
VIVAAIFTLLSIALMVKLSNSTRLVWIASTFLISIYLVVALNNFFNVIDDKHVLVLFSYLALYFGGMALNSSFRASCPYIAHSAVYFILAIEDTIVPRGLMDGIYYEIMYGLLVFLIISVIYDRMGDIELRADSLLS